MVAATLWAIAYAALGVLSGGIFDSPLLATLLATLLVLVVGGVLNLLGARRRTAPRDDRAAGAAPGGAVGTSDARPAEAQTSPCEHP